MKVDTSAFETWRTGLWWDDDYEEIQLELLL